VTLASTGTWAFYAGNSTAANAPFRVGFNGAMVATSGTFSGNISATDISGGNISGTNLSGITISSGKASFGRDSNLTNITTGGGTLTRSAQTGATTSGSVSSDDSPTVEIVRDSNSSGYLSFYRPSGGTNKVGIQFYVNASEGGGSSTSGYLRGVIDHTAEAVTGSSDTGGTLRLLAIGSSTGNTGGRILLQANNSISAVPGKIDLRATEIYMTSIKGTTAAGDLGTTGQNFRMVSINTDGSNKGKLGQGTKITFGNNTSPSTANTSPQDGDLHFSY
jgi:hypothetical protein